MNSGDYDSENDSNGSFIHLSSPNRADTPLSSLTASLQPEVRDPRDLEVSSTTQDLASFSQFSLAPASLSQLTEPLARSFPAQVALQPQAQAQAQAPSGKGTMSSSSISAQYTGGDQALPETSTGGCCGSCSVSACVKSIPPQVKDLVLWTNWPISLAAALSGLVLLLLLDLDSFISVVSYLGFLLILLGLAARVQPLIAPFLPFGKRPASTSTSQPQQEDSFFKTHVENQTWELSEECAKKLVEKLRPEVNCLLREMRELILLNDYIKVAKCAIFFWFLYCLGSWFNLLTLLEIAWVAVFAVPKGYMQFKEQIDNGLLLARDEITKVINIVKSKIPLKQKKN